MRTKGKRIAAGARMAVIVAVLGTYTVRERVTFEVVAIFAIVLLSSAGVSFGSGGGGGGSGDGGGCGSGCGGG